MPKGGVGTGAELRWGGCRDGVSRAMGDWEAEGCPVRGVYRRLGWVQVDGLGAGEVSECPRREIRRKTQFLGEM